MSKLLKSHAMGLPEAKNQKGRKFDETCRVCTSTCIAYVKKTKK